MNDLYDAVGNVADKHRLTLFEPPALPAPWPNPLGAAFALDASGYHRLRMMARHWLTRSSRSWEDLMALILRPT